MVEPRHLVSEVVKFKLHGLLNESAVREKRERGVCVYVCVCERETEREREEAESIIITNAKEIKKGLIFYPNQTQMKNICFLLLHPFFTYLS